MNGKAYLRAAIFCVIFITFVPGADAAARGKGGGGNFLWKVQSKKGVVYLFGSIHLAKPELYPLDPIIEKSFAESSILALEADPGRGMEQGLQERILLSALYTGGETLEQKLSRETYELAVGELRRTGLPVEQFSRMKPWFLALTLGLLEFQRLGYRPEYGLDRYFAGEAQGKKKIVELESFDYQANLLNGFSDREQELFLLYTIRDIKTVEENIGTMVHAWQSGDAKTMESLVLQPLDEYPELMTIYEKLFFRRNREMTARIEKLLQSGKTCFIVTGAAHLVGKQGIVELLKGRGYKILQM